MGKITCLAVAVALALPGLAAGASSTEAVDGAVNWASQVYDPVAELVFGPPIADHLAPEVAWVATARIAFAYNSEPEIQIALRKEFDGRVTAAVTRLQEPLYTQLRSLYSNYRESPIEEIATRVKVDRYSVAGEQAGSLAELARSFEKLEAPFDMTNGLVMDPRHYQLWLDAGSERMHLSLLGGSDGQSPHPVIRWIEGARAKLERLLWRPL